MAKLPDVKIWVESSLTLPKVQECYNADCEYYIADEHLCKLRYITIAAGGMCFMCHRKEE